ncbi:chromosome partitioning protein [Polymorphobacter multimanifer]|uniref:Chromosome partitioning protein n=1 Tax=Polymorphobacter multimanifer TaxID=1070431 RepID=A0A841L143_9SPHN|nr:division plane positioning ATPase MipZ [Polymorphobacter multimanifer]MBB6226539.1 chromosome partitioning protein [Polymorphobacter multimanifer]
MPLHIIALGNEKGGTGKSTTAVHIGVALTLAGFRTAMLDLDSRQRTTARYLENRVAFAARRGLALATPDHITIADGEGAEAELALRLEQAAAIDFLIIDTPGRDSALARAALARADTIITPINDSFIDFDLIGEVDPETFAVKKPGFYAALVFEQRQARARHDGGSIDWVVLRNRLSTLEARNRKRMGAALDQLSKRIGFRQLPGLSERVIYREFFPRGLTLLDRGALEDFSISHVGARAELRALLAALNLPGWDPARLPE